MSEIIKLRLGISGTGSYESIIINLVADNLDFYAIKNTYKANLAFRVLENSIIKGIEHYEKDHPEIRYIILECPDGTIELLSMLQELPNHAYRKLMGVERDRLKEKILPIYLSRSLAKSK
jgi:hypothetical protein